ncbi:Signal peptidase complex subunit 3 [Perkinsus olseni]|uniref:Signal peptidase complex subunit 3 n=1 Tax=Perkinsus olseni TaxID=32597 RepID=A0A7J6R6X6_PEROL|nr:Signal peptidase complex subunit 3 [Perkinsus olseni]KAF4716639.1 Signal peptidase complex subunit 3 [Perkinsus olseni]
MDNLKAIMPQNMESYTSRANTIFCTYCSVLCFLGLLCHFTSYIDPTPIVSGTVTLAGVQDIVLNGFLRADQANLQLDIDADLRQEMRHWSMNQLFVYITADYVTDSAVRNSVTIWDDIVRSEEEALIHLEGVTNEYPLRDVTKGTLRDNNITLTLHYQTMPIIGQMRQHSLPPSESYRLPSEYIKGKSSGYERPKKRRPSARPKKAKVGSRKEHPYSVEDEEEL